MHEAVHYSAVLIRACGAGGMPHRVRQVVVECTGAGRAHPGDAALRPAPGGLSRSPGPCLTARAPPRFGWSGGGRGAHVSTKTAVADAPTATPRETVPLQYL